MSANKLAAQTARIDDVTTPAPAAQYEFDASHSTAQFAVKHMMVSTVRGEIRNVAGTITLDDANPERSRVEATIDVGTIDTGVEKRDAHLRSADFFDVETFPTITFASTAVKKLATDQYEVSGDLTMHGVTRPVVLAVESAPFEIKDPYGNIKRGAVATTSVNRKDFGLNWNVALEAGGVLVGEKVQVTLDLSLNRKL